MGDPPKPTDDAPKPAGDSPKPKFEGPDRRERYRLGKETKILVAVGKRSEVGTIINMTRNGVFFLVFGEYERGMMLDVTFPYIPTQPSQERPQHAEVVRVQEMEGSIKKGVAVRLLNMFLKP